MTVEKKHPLLIYDAECGFCQYWVDYWKKLTGDKVLYLGYQHAGKDYPQITEQQFRKSIFYVAQDGKIYSAAEASFRVLDNVPGKRFWLKLYKNVPGFRPVSEFSYAFIAKRRPFFFKISKSLWGKSYEPPRYDNVSWLFLRLLGLVFLSAFLSFAVQAQGLIGSNGLLPLTDLTKAATEQIGVTRYWLMPMVFWIDDSDFAINAVSWAGVFLSVLLTLGILTRISLFLLCILYLSVMYGGQTFMSFQWDLYLIEMGFIALLMCFCTTMGIWLLRWLLFRFMFMGGAVKLLSDDPTWRDFTALNYHFETQPLPTPSAWYFHHLQQDVLSFMTFSTLFVELLVPFLIFMPRNIRFVSAAIFLAFQLIIVLTGNYNFFNMMTIFLLVPLLDDAAIRKFIPRRLYRPEIPSPHRYILWVGGAIAAFTILVSTVQMDMRMGGRLPTVLVGATRIIDPIRVVNIYGPFAVMTTRRMEIVIEGTSDGQEWKEYEFIYKPGDVNKPLFWNIPHQPRLDWQMWFAALGTADRNPWFGRLILRLLQNEPSVTALFKVNPFPDKPPRAVRAAFYEYKFTAPQQAQESHAWWTREFKGYYFPEAKLK